jgi:anaerobic dimethyl sulfoxide reductase subunit A
MNNEVLSQWIYCSWFSAFFEGIAEWRERTVQIKSLAQMDGDIVPFGFKEEQIQQEYEDLFKGTNADIYIPLWASVCINEDGSLLDATTLDVLEEYHRWGFEPINMDGNPPDFIGQQFRFLCYLYACALHAEEKGGSAAQYLEEIRRFKDRYLLSTVQVVSKGICDHSRNAIFKTMANKMIDYLTNETEVLPVEKYDIAVYKNILDCYPNFLMGKNQPTVKAEAEVIYTAGRNNCGGKCSISATVKAGCVLGLDTGCQIGAPQLRACVRGRGYRKTYLTGQRLRYPMKRIGERGEGRFKRISWEEAAETIASEWRRIKRAYGPESRYVNYGIGVSATIRPDLLTRRLLNLDGGHLSYYGSYSFACTQFVTPYIYGDKFSGNSLEDILNTKLLILWGHNPAETIFGSQLTYFITQLKAKGVRIIVIDPRQSDTVVTLADEWIGIKPSTDAALADAMAHVIWSEDLQDQTFMNEYCIGFDEEHMPEGIPKNQSYRTYIFGKLDGIPKNPEWAESITGIKADTIKKLAREYASVKPACLLPGLGNQRIGNGEQTVRGMAMLACLTGNVGISGGGAAGAGFVREEAWPEFPVGENPYPGAISCFLWTKAMEDAMNMTQEEDGIQGVKSLGSNIKLMFNLAGNTLVNQHSDINNSIRILKDKAKCELIVCSDVFMTPSAKFADILLPAPSFLEEDNIAPPWRAGHYLLCNNKVIEPIFGCRTEYDWLSDVAKRLGLWEQWSEGRIQHTHWLEYLYNKLRKDKPELPEYAVFKQRGGHTYENAAPYIAYKEQIHKPEHIKFSTPSGRIEIFSKQLFDMNKHEEIPAIPRYVPCPEGPEDPAIHKYPLQLIGWHTKRRCHSIHDNNSWLEEVEPQRVWIHPDDAAKRGIMDLSVVSVFNDRGRIRLPAKITERVIKGVVAIPQGAWYTPNSAGIDHRGSINVLTSTRPTPLAKGNPQHTNLVEVEMGSAEAT